MISRWVGWAVVPMAALAFAVAAMGATPRSGRQVAAVESPSAPGKPSAELAPPQHERDVARTVAMLLERQHYARFPVDDEISRRWFANYLDRLDYQRMVLLQSDVDQFRERFETTMDNGVQAEEPDVEAAFVMYERYRNRMRDRLDAVDRMLKGEIDLTNKESWVPNRHDHVATWPKTDDEANNLWRQRLEEEFIIGKMERESEDDVRERLRKRYQRYRKSIDDTESTDVMSSWLGSLGASFDPHSQWMAPANNDAFDISITNSVTGIGASLRTEGDFTEIVEIIPGGPAFESKRLFPEDRILAVAQGRDEPVDVVGQRIDKVVKLIRGEVGTEVRLHVVHADGEREIVVMTRARVTLEESAVEHKVIDLDGRKYGVVDLPSFYVDPEGRRNGRRASADVKAALAKLREADVDGMVLDLRENGGGALREAIDVAGLFIPSGPIVQVRDRHGQIKVLHDRDPQVHWLKPMVVLVDPTSASASEIVAGALQDYERAVIVGGAQTHGKGTVQEVVGLTDLIPGRHREDVGGALKLTIQKFYRVSGGSTQNKGVLSDVTVPTRWDGLDVLESDVENALPYDEIPKAQARRYGDLDKILPKLRDRSAKRMKANSDFDGLQQELTERAAVRAAKEVSLHLETRCAEFEAREARLGRDGSCGPTVATNEDEDEAADEDDSPDFVLNEAVAVLNDLTRMSRGK